MRLTSLFVAFVACAPAASKPQETHSVPAQMEVADLVSDDELAVLATTGELIPIADGKAAQDRATHDAQVAADSAALADLRAHHPELGVVLSAITQDPSDPQVLSDEATRMRDIVSGHAAFDTPENQAGIYAALFPLLPDACQIEAPDAAMTLDVLHVLIDQAIACWQIEMPGFGAAAVDTPPTRGTDVDPNKCQPQATYDRNLGLFGRSRDTPVKQQGNRGSCTAFAITGAVETAVYRAQTQSVNLSEQALYAKAKTDWSPNDWYDGLGIYSTATKMRDTGYNIPFEDIWPYNPAYHRTGDENTGYAGSCTGYLGPACGDTVHEAKHVCSQSGHCSYWLPTAPSNGVGIKKVLALYDITRPTTLAIANTLISMGYTLVASINVPPHFRDDIDTKGHWQPAPSATLAPTGGHSMEVSSIIFNAHLPAGEDEGRGGGYVTFKNSWGTCWGNGGYFFVAFEDLPKILTSLTLISTDTLPTNHAPTLHIDAPLEGEHFQIGALNPPIAFAATVADQEDGAQCCAVTWISTHEFLGKTTSVSHYVSGSGPQTITVTVTDSQGKKTIATRTIYLDNDAPTVSIASPSSGAHFTRGQSVIVQGASNDVNDVGSLPCASLVWTSSVASDAINGAMGCEIEATFATDGARTLTLIGTDSGGLSASANINIIIDAPTPHTPPAVTIVYPTGTAAAPTFISNPNAPITLQVNVTDADGDPSCPTGTPKCLSYVWRTRIGTGAYTTLGSTKSLAWTPASTYGSGGCLSYAIELNFCSADEDGATCKSTFAYLSYPPC